MEDIVLENINKSFDEKSVLSGLSMRFCGGRTTCVMGRSGCGKTTLMRIIAGLEKPDSGTVTGVPEKVGYVFQEDRLCEDFSAVRNIRLVTGHSMHRHEIASVLERLGIDSADISRPVSEFSGGMKRRVALARAVCFRPDLLILDEPFKGLDGELKMKAIEFVKENTAGRTVICVTHDPAEAALLNSETAELK